MVDTTLEDDRRPTNGHTSRSGRVAISMPANEPDAEQSVLGCMALSREAAQTAIAQLKPTDFYEGRNQVLFAAIAELIHARRPCDPVTLADHLRRSESLLDIAPTKEEAYTYLHHIIEAVPHAGHVRYYGEIVRDRSWRRQIKERYLSAAQTAEDPSVDIETLLIRPDFSDLKTSTPNPFNVITSAELATVTPEIAYLVEGVIVRGQPCILGGAKKTLKTNVLIDLSLSLAHGGQFLGTFKVTEAMRVGLLSGESGAATIAETARRIAESKRYGLEYFENVFWGFTLPRLGEPRDMAALRSFIVANKLDVVIIDPTYLALPLGDLAGNLFEVGAKLVGLTQLGQDLDCTIILAHHTRKNVVNAFDPPELEDIAWAGFPEWARQWILIGRRRKYDPEHGGHHELWLNIGGSAGHSSLWALNIDEGTRQDQSGRRWDVAILKASEARAVSAVDEKQRRQTAAQQRESAQAESDREKVLTAFRSLSDGDSKTQIRDVAGLPTKRFAPVLAALINDRTVEPCSVKKGNKQAYEGYRLTREHPGTVGIPGLPG